MNRGADRGHADALLVRAASGDRGAFAAFYDEMAGRVFGVCRRILRDYAQAEEVTQEVMLELWRTAPRFEPGRGSASSWAASLAHRRSVDRVRSSQASRDREARDPGPAPAFDSTAERVTDREERENVRDALEALTPLQREAIELAYYGGLTYREVAERLDTPLGTVKSRLRDGLIRMRDVLSGSEGHDG